METPAQETPAQETKSVLSDSVLQEFEKVAEIEKGLRFLQFRQGSVEKSITEIKHVITKEDTKNVISDEIKENEKQEDEDDKNVVKKEKVTQQLTSIEKKRYENIGIEFAKGAGVIFQELKKNEELKKKMSTKEVDKIVEEEKKEKKKEKEKKKKKSSFMILALAIGAIASLLWIFRDKVDELIPGFKSGFENVVTPIKNMTNEILTKLGSFMVENISNPIKQLFETVGNSIHIFLTAKLPEMIFEAGIGLLQLFSVNEAGTIDDYVSQTESGTSNTIELGHALDEAQKNSRGRQQQMQSMFLSEGQIMQMRTYSGEDAVVSLNNQQFYESMSHVALGIQATGDTVNSNLQNWNGYFQSILDSKVLGENGVLDYTAGDENKTDSEIYKLAQMTHQFSGSSEDFATWWNKNKQFFIQNTALLNQSFSNFQRTTAATDELENKRKRDLERMNQYGNLFRVDENGNYKIDITPVINDIATVEFVEVVDDILKLFGGISITGETIIEGAANFTKSIVDGFLSPALNKIQKLSEVIFNTINNVSFTSNTQNTSVTNNSTQGGVVNVLRMPNNSSAPVVLVELSLSSDILSELQTYFTSQENIITKIGETNAALKTLGEKYVVVQNGGGDNSGVITGVQAQIQNNNKLIMDATSRIGHIEKYLEDQDGVDDDGRTKDFVLQATAS